MREFRSMIEYKAMWEEEKRNLQNLRIEACIGLRDEQNIVGILLLSNPPGNHRIGRSDLDMILMIASSASIARTEGTTSETSKSLNLGFKPVAEGAPQP